MNDVSKHNQVSEVTLWKLWKVFVFVYQTVGPMNDFTRHTLTLLTQMITMEMFFYPWQIFIHVCLVLSCLEKDSLMCCNFYSD